MKTIIINLTNVIIIIYNIQSILSLILPITIAEVYSKK